jgi:hypothetical protein
VLVKVNIFGLTVIFAALLTLCAALLAAALVVGGAAHGVGYLDLWRDELMSLLGLSVDMPKANIGNGLGQAINLAQGFLALVLPALYIGAIAFRLFLDPGVFIFRREICLQEAPETYAELDGLVLAIRGYNASRMKALDLSFTAAHQHWFKPEETSVVINHSVEIFNPRWPMADQHVPYTFFIPLESGDVNEEAGKRTLVKLQGRAVDSRDRLVVHVSGTMPDLRGTFVERYAFDLPESVSEVPWGGVQVAYRTKSKTWDGWDGFDA